MSSNGVEPAAAPPAAPDGSKFCLKWNNFGRNVTSSFKNLLANEEFVDISLSAQGKTIKAHRVVLSASSQYFRDLLHVSGKLFGLDQIPRKVAEIERGSAFLCFRRVTRRAS